MGPLGLPWWPPLLLLAVAVLLVRRAARRWRAAARGVLERAGGPAQPDGRTRVIALVLVAVFAQIARNWLLLHAVGVDASVFDATAVLIAMVVLASSRSARASARRRWC